VGYVPEVPGVNAQERTLGAARRALMTAFEELAKIDPTVMRGNGQRIEHIDVRISRLFPCLCSDHCGSIAYVPVVPAEV